MEVADRVVGPAEVGLDAAGEVGGGGECLGGLLDELVGVEVGGVGAVAGAGFGGQGPADLVEGLGQAPGQRLQLARDGGEVGELGPAGGAG